MSKFWSGNNKAAKLSASQVAELRRQYATGSYTQGALSRIYQLSVVQIGRIVRGEVWQTVLPPSEDPDAILQRALKIQEEMQKEQSAQDKMVEAIKARNPDQMLNELTGEGNGTSRE